MFLYDIITESAQSSIKLIDKDMGFYPAGNNGPHGHKETPVRNTAHWLITLLKAYEISGNDKFYVKAINLCDYLLSDHLRPNNYTFIARNITGLDSCNGLIGQAWVIEALAEASKALREKDCYNLAKKIFLMHTFEPRVGLWKIRKVDGSIGDFDLTLNHQIWFAAAGGLLNDEDVNNVVKQFLDRLLSNLSLSKEGCFLMPVKGIKHFKQGSLLVPIKTSKIYNWIRLTKRGDSLKKMYDGYHSFHLYGLSMLKEQFSNHYTWERDYINRSLMYIFNENFRDSVLKSKYGINYNPPGLEIAYTLYTFKEKIKNYDVFDIMKEWLGYQFNKTYNYHDKLMNKVKYDPITYAARLYEATRLPNIKFNKV